MWPQSIRFIRVVAVVCRVQRMSCPGLRFALQVHEKLLAADWPASLREDAPICSPQDSLWGGLTVRIGVNTGPVAIEQNIQIS